MADTFTPGDTFDYSGPVKINGSIQPMTGWSAVLNISRKGLASETLIVSVSGVWEDVTNAVIRFTVANTSAWPTGEPLVLQTVLMSPDSKKSTSNKVTLLTAKGLAP